MKTKTLFLFTLAWLDMPLPGSQYTLEPINILAHASAPAGVTALAFNVDGELVDTISTDTGAQSLVTIRHQWTPIVVGTYTLSVAARDLNGNWSQPSEVSITVLESLPEEPEFQVPVAPPDVPPTAVPPTTVPIIPVTPTVTFTNTAPPPATTQPPPPDTEKPVITQLIWNPVSPNEDETISFAVTATDNAFVARIEIYFVRQGETAQGSIKVCQSTSVCEHQAISGFRWGNYTYYAIAYDLAGNSVISFTQTVQILQVIK